MVRETASHDEPAEQAILGLILAGYPDLPGLTRLLDAQDFYQPRHSAIWNACLAVHREGLQPDLTTVLHQLGSHAPKWGGGLYLLELSEKAGIGPQASWYAGRIRDCATRRQLGLVATRLEQLHQDTDRDVTELVALARQELESVERPQGDTTSIWSAYEQVLETVDHGEVAGLSTPWPGLTDLIGGWFPGQLVVIGARPGVGKSIALENVATDCARRHNRRVLIVSLEMSAKEVTQRTLAYTARVNLSRIRAGASQLSASDLDAITRASKTMTGTKVEFCEDSQMTVDNIRAVAWAARQRAVRDGDVFGMLVVDYAQLIATGRDSRQTRQQLLGEVSRGLKRLARELGVPVLVAAQLGRDAQERVPILSDIREAGDFENDADVVIFLHEERVEEGGRVLPTGEVQLIVAKSRNGPLGVRSVQKYGHYAYLHEGAA